MNDIEFLDILAIVSFALQMCFMEETQKQASNNDILVNLHQDLEVVDAKLDKIIEHLAI